MAQRLKESRIPRIMRRIKEFFHKPEPDNSRKLQNKLDARLLKAAKEGRTGKARRLLKKGANILAEDRIGWGPLMFAVYGNNIGTCAFLIDRGVDINVKSREGLTALMLAACWGYTEICEFLIGKGADVNATDYDGETALKTARSNGENEQPNS